MQAGEARVLAWQLELRFGPLADATRKLIEGASSETLLEWSRKVLTASRLDDVIAPG
jgi:nitrogenase subunit NifH